MSVICLPVLAADFSGDGTGDLAIFRPASGLWAVRGVTRIYFGSSGDLPVPGDYSGSGTDAAAVFRGSSGLWAVRGVTRIYFGGGTDQPKPGDYSGDGTSDFGIFRPGTGLWAVRGVTRVYFGTSTDIAIDPGPPRSGPGGVIATGDAEPPDVLSGRTFSRDGEAGLTGTMPDRGSPTWTPGTSDQNLDAGYYGGGTVSGDADLVAGNIRSGVNVFGVAGDPNVVNTSSGDAVTGDIKSGKKAWVDGAEVTGTIATRTLSAGSQTVSAGFYEETTLSGVDADLATANIKSGVTVFGFAGDPNVVNTSSGDAIAGDIKSGKKAWVDGAEVTGTIATRTLSADSQTVSAGFYEETTLSGVDADLAAGNIKSGATIFGVAGSYSGGGLLKTGQSFSYHTGDDGYYQKGVAFSYQTSDPAANGEIVTTDNMTGLMWASDGAGAGCYSGGTRTWTQALDWAEGLTFASYDDWRLPNITELQTLFVRDAGQAAPYINTTFFPNTVSSSYWSSTTYPFDTTSALGAYFFSGYVGGSYNKTSTLYVRVVRGGE